MSYTSYAGTIKFKKKEHFEQFLAEMINHRWFSMKHKAWMNDEDPVNVDGSEEADVKVLDPKKLTITLPNYPIDNFHRLFNALKENTWVGEIRGTSDDGCFEGYILKPDGTEECIDLEEWAKEHNKVLTWDEENEDWATDERCDLMDDFINDPHPPKNATKFITND